MTWQAGGYVAYLAITLATHALVGYALGAVLFDRPGAGLIGGLVADVDLLVPASAGFPLAHRGLTHSALALGVVAALGLAHGKTVAGALGAGYASQLVMDATTPMGIPLLYPLSDAFVHLEVGIGAHSGPATALLWIASLFLLWAVRSESASFGTLAHSGTSSEGNSVE